MTKTAHFNNFILVFGIPVLLIIAMVFLAQTSVFVSNQKMMSLAMTIDLLFTIPVVYYLLIRKKNIPKTTIIPIFILGIVIATFIIPKENQFLLEIAKTWILPLMEISILSFIGYKVYKSFQLYKQNKNDTADFFNVVKNICYEIAPKRMAIALATEIGIIYYGFVNWKTYVLKPNEFTYHKNSGTITLLVAFIFVALIETIALHLLFAKWSTTVAWIFTALSLYTIIQLFGLLKSISRRPVTIEKSILHLRYGIFSETSIFLNEIESVEVNSGTIQFDKEIRKFSLFGDLEGHNMVIKLKKENVIIGFYGIKKNYKTIAFYVDEKEVFKTKLESLLNH